MKKNVLVAMSGGVDSSLAAAMLKRKGWDVVGATMKLWPAEQCLKERPQTSCCSLAGIEDARTAAAKLDIPYYVFDFSGEFKTRVIDYFCKAYAFGITPNPCILCNQFLKFDLLLKKARGLGCDYLATGHYARVGYNSAKKRYFIREGKDKQRDQSYFLAFLSQEALSRAIFPLGDMTKDQARKIAKKIGLKVHNKPSSQEICFVPGHYAEYLTKSCRIADKEGEIINKDGRTLGRHKGVHHYTIGQRKGLGIAYREPLYVIGIDKDKNTLTVGTKKEVLRKTFVAKEPFWYAAAGIKKPLRVIAKIRYGHKKAAATVEKIAANKLKVSFDRPQEAITPGQAAVFYRGDAVLGGGWIDSA